MKWDIGEIATNIAEGVHIAMTLAQPVSKLDRQFERALRFANEFIFVNT